MFTVILSSRITRLAPRATAQRRLNCLPTRAMTTRGVEDAHERHEKRKSQPIVESCSLDR